MLSLAHRILSENPIVWYTKESPEDMDLRFRRAMLEREAMKHVPHLRCDNVATLICSGTKELWDYARDMPNWAPPFERFYFEFTIPKESFQPPETHDGQGGGIVAVREVTDLTRLDYPGWRGGFNQFFVCSENRGLTDDFMREGLTEARWVMCVSHWAKTCGGPYNGKAAWLGTNTLIFVAPDGRQIMNYTCSLYGIDRGCIEQLIGILGLSLSFLNCKNVTRIESVDDRGERWHRRTGAPRLKYYTLNINPMREVLRTEGNSDQVGLKRALHICRGHFATYAEDKPLFGRLSGTFWRPDHVRGTTECGIVAKDYSVAV